jgi:hypothetical protein
MALVHRPGRRNYDKEEDGTRGEHRDERPKLPGHRLRGLLWPDEFDGSDHVHGIDTLPRLHLVKRGHGLIYRQIGGTDGRLRVRPGPADLYDRGVVDVSAEGDLSSRGVASDGADQRVGGPQVTQAAERIAGAYVRQLRIRGNLRFRGGTWRGEKQETRRCLVDRWFNLENVERGYSRQQDDRDDYELIAPDSPDDRSKIHQFPPPSHRLRSQHAAA